jgi:tetratricopeptide (TPR) repeat protein
MNMCRQSLIGLATVSALLTGLAGVAPVAADDRDDCVKGSGDARIAACTRVIASTPRDHVAWAYANRGLGWRSKGDNDRAIADLDEAIRIDPRHAPAYVSRGWSWHIKHDEERAISDLNEAIRLDSNNAEAYAARGAIYETQKDLDRALSDYDAWTRIQPNNHYAYFARGSVYERKKDYDRALVDYNAAISSDPKFVFAYSNRGLVYLARRDYDRALADFNEAIRLDPNFAGAHQRRGAVYLENKQDYDRALADFDDAIRIDPNMVSAYLGRGNVFYKRQDYDRALSDYNNAIRLDSKNSAAYNGRGVVYNERRDYDRALADFNEALRLDPANVRAIANRGLAYQGKGDLTRATAELYEALRRDTTLGYARLALANIKPATPSTATAPTGPAQPAGKPLRRVALIISNSNYASFGTLPNPKHDAELIASVLKLVGFQSVELKSDLTRDQTLKALQDFAAASDNADWSVFYYSGHGVAYNGVNYMVPVDARLKADRDIDIEAVDAGKVSNAMAGASKLHLVVLDMCRSNPFIKSMKRTTMSRAIGRGLAPPPEDDSGEYTAFAARDGQEALDGDGDNSPFAESLAKRLQMPNVDVRRVFDYVRDDVLRVTNRQQQPFTYGSLPPVDFYFVQR